MYVRYLLKRQQLKLTFQNHYGPLVHNKECEEGDYLWPRCQWVLVYILGRSTHVQLK